MWQISKNYLPIVKYLKRQMVYLATTRRQEISTALHEAYNPFLSLPFRIWLYQYWPCSAGKHMLSKIIYLAPFSFIKLIINVFKMLFYLKQESKRQTAKDKHVLLKTGWHYLACIAKMIAMAVKPGKLSDSKKNEQPKRYIRNNWK